MLKLSLSFLKLTLTKLAPPNPILLSVVNFKLLQRLLLGSQKFEINDYEPILFVFNPSPGGDGQEVL